MEGTATAPAAKVATPRHGTRLLRRRLKLVGRLAGAYLLLIPGALLFALPFLFMLSTSLKSFDQLFKDSLEWIPNPVMWENYYNAWVKTAPFTLYFRNSVVVVLAVVTGTLLSCSLVAYAFARLEWFGRDAWFLVVLATMMLPHQVTLIPVFLVFTKLGWVNTLLPLTVPAFFGNAFIIFLFRQFLMTIPVELDDAARVDGCSTLGIYWRILLPLVKPALATGAIFTFISSWNDFLTPLIYLNKPQTFTLPLGLANFRTEYTVNWPYLMAASFLIMLPCLIVFFLAQRWFIEGIVLTGLKG